MADVKDTTESDVVRIFDTTLRDGEQSPGASLNPEQKVDVARQLDRLGVDVIEAGFPIASPGDLDSVRRVARVVKRAEVAALARCVRRDIDAAADALRDAPRPVLHVFLATSDIHLKHKLRMSRTEVVRQVAEMVAYGRDVCPNARIEFSAEDATRTDWDYLACVCDAAVQSGATTVNLPDTVGYSMADEYATMFRYVRERIYGGDRVVFSAHCHDDLGMATANTLAAIAAGARQVEVTINGLGERAGNAPLEEVVMALKTRSDTFGVRTGIDSRELVPSSRMVSELTGLMVQANKAVVGSNAFAHEAGIHQDGFIKERTTYEIIHPEDVGWESTRLVLGKHSGRHGVAFRLRQLGYDLDRETLEDLYEQFVLLADRQKYIEDEDLHTLVIAVGAEAVVTSGATR